MSVVNFMPTKKTRSTVHEARLINSAFPKLGICFLKQEGSEAHKFLKALCLPTAHIYLMASLHVDFDTSAKPWLNPINPFKIDSLLAIGAEESFWVQS